MKSKIFGLIFIITSIMLQSCGNNATKEESKNDTNGNDTTIIKEKNTMEITLKVEGMMCPHCEARVKSVLEALDGVLVATPSHEKGEVKIELSAEVPVDTLKSTIEAQGYKVS